MLQFNFLGASISAIGHVLNVDRRRFKHERNESNAASHGSHFFPQLLSSLLAFYTMAYFVANATIFLVLAIHHMITKQAFAHGRAQIAYLTFDAFT